METDKAEIKRRIHLHEGISMARGDGILREIAHRLLDIEITLQEIRDKMKGKT